MTSDLLCIISVYLPLLLLVQGIGISKAFRRVFMVHHSYCQINISRTCNRSRHNCVIESRKKLKKRPDTNFSLLLLIGIVYFLPTEFLNSECFMSV